MRRRRLQQATALAQKYCPEALAYLHLVLRDEAQAVHWRMRAAEIILRHGMPSKVEAAADTEQIGAITLHLVMPKPDEPLISHPMLTIDTLPEGSAD